MGGIHGSGVWGVIGQELGIGQECVCVRGGTGHELGGVMSSGGGGV